MTTPQHKIGSGFGCSTTADEVLAGIDLTGRLAIVTGGYSGIGLETTRALAKAGTHVVVPARRVAPAREAVGDLAEVDELDLGDLGWDDPQFERGYDKWQAYALFAVELDRRGADAGVCAFAADGTPLFDFKTPEQGAATQVWAATSPQLDGMGGVYLVDCDIAELDGVHPYAINPDSARRLWAMSAELTGVDLP